MAKDNRKRIAVKKLARKLSGLKKRLKGMLTDANMQSVSSVTDVADLLKEKPKDNRKCKDATL